MTTTASESLAERAQRLMPGGVSSPVRALRAMNDAPLFVSRGAGAHLFDSDGNVLLDYIGSWGAAITGHAHPAVEEAVVRAVRDGLGFGATSSLEVELAEMIVERVPRVEQVRFVCSGTEAVMSAVRLARAATGRDLLVRFTGCYHGHGDSLLSGSGSGVATLGLPDSPGVPIATARDTIALPYNDSAAVADLFAARGDRVACVIVEPIAGNMGVVPGSHEFLATLRALTLDHGALLIFDEVMTGFRVAAGGAQELAGISADLVTMGKVIGGGLPVGAYAGSTRLMQMVAPAGPVYQAGTLAGNPITMAAGIATLRLLDASAYRQLESHGRQLSVGLEERLAAAGVKARVQRVGSMVSLFFGTGRNPLNHDDVKAADHDTFARFFRRMRQLGVLLPPSGYESWFLSLAHTTADIERTLDAAALALGDEDLSTVTARGHAVRQWQATDRIGHGDSPARVFDNVFEMLPDVENPTPIVRLNRLSKRPRFPIYAKLEWMNPFGSVKDRAAWSMLRDLEERGLIGPDVAPGRGLVEPTSGNTGLSLAALASARGYAMRAVVPNRIPLEKKVLLKLAGAELDVINDELCPMPGLGDGSINIARSHAKAQPDRYVMPNQYANRANVEAHMRTTGPEIWRQTGGRVTHVFCSLGTCGTATGLSLYLKARNPDVRIVAVQPTEGHDVPGLRNVSQLGATELFDASLIDEIIEIEYELAYARAVDLARQEGLLAGPSSGLVLEGALRVLARDADAAGLGVMVFPDSVFKYTSNFIKHLPDLARGTEP